MKLEFTNSNPATQKPVYSVSQLNQQVRQLLEGNFPALLIEGEISNLKKPSSGHLYFSLKDPFSQVRCAMFRLRSNALSFELKDGMHVLVQAKISLYEERGDYQLIVQNIEETGDGALRRAFEQLKQRLAQEGLFNTQHKKPLPSFPSCIGIITSPTGAAVRDILHVLQRRFPALPIIIYPTQVQGVEAAGQIVAALKTANERAECDVLILARGGGSLEDLWPFNEEIVARAIFASRIPIVSGIGHEIDFTIADFVADQRAPTPSAAAELISPNSQEYLQKINHYYLRLQHFIKVELRHLSQLLHNLTKRLRHPTHQLLEYAQRLGNLEKHLLKAQSGMQLQKSHALQNLVTKLQVLQPRQLLLRLNAEQNQIQQQLISIMTYRLRSKQQELVSLVRSLDAVSPLNTLQRGYAILSKEQEVIDSIADIHTGEKLNARLSDGELVCIVKEKFLN